jgi:acetyl esterase
MNAIIAHLIRPVESSRLRRPLLALSPLALAIAVVLTAAPAVPASAAAADAAPQTLEYAPGLVLDAYAAAEVDAPWVMLIHGGYWKGNRHQLDGVAGDFVDAGYAVFNIEYRRPSQGRWPAQLDDAKAALRWITDRASDLGIDPGLGFAVGSSAGGHIALSLAEAGADLRGVVAVSSPVVLLDSWKAGKKGTASGRAGKLARAARELMGCTPSSSKGKCRTRWKSASPIPGYHRGDPPVLLLHSKKDKLVPIGESRKFFRVADRVSPASRMITLSGSRHGVSALDRSLGRVLDWMDDRLDGRRAPAG